MFSIELAVIVAATAFTQLSNQSITPGKMALDMNVECVSLLGKNLYATPAEGDTLKALEARLAKADKLVAEQPEDPAVYTELGNALNSLWRYHDAARAYSHAIALNPADATAYALRANAFGVLRQFKQARADFQHASAIDPKNADHWTGIGITNYLLGEFNAAHEAFLTASRSAPSAHTAGLIVTWDSWAAPRATPAQTPVAGEPDNAANGEQVRYLAGLEMLQANDRDGALAVWHGLAESNNWTSIWVIAAEAEIAAIEGAKNMKSSV